MEPTMTYDGEGSDGEFEVRLAIATYARHLWKVVALCHSTGEKAFEAAIREMVVHADQMTRYEERLASNGSQANHSKN